MSPIPRKPEIPIHCACIKQASWPAVAVLLVCLFQGGVNAAELPPADKEQSDPARQFSVRGFGTLGIARSNSDQAEFVRDLSQPSGVTDQWSAKIDSIAGVQANFRATDKLEAVVQAVSHYRNEGNFSPDLSWAFIKFDTDSRISLRAGKLGTEFYMLADSRLVSYSYLTVRPPGDFYGTLPFSYVEGVDGLLTIPWNEGLIRGKLFTGFTCEKVPLGDRQWDLSKSLMSGGYVDFQKGDWQWRVSYADIRFKNDLPLTDLMAELNASGPSQAANELSVANKLASFYSAGMAYDSGPIQLQLMLGRTQQESAVFENATSGYLIAGYRISEVTPFAGYSWLKTEPRELAAAVPPMLSATVASVMADSHADQHTVILGARWDVYRNMALKAQLDMIRGTDKSIFPYRQENPDFDGQMNVFSLAMDFIF